MIRLSNFLLLMLGVFVFALGGCAVDKAQYRDNLLVQIDSNLQSVIESNTPEYFECFSGDKDVKIALLEGAYWECVWELDEKLPETVTAGSDLTRWLEELDACGTSNYMNKMFKKDNIEFQKNNANCSNILQGYYLVSSEAERLKIVVDTFRDIMDKNVTDEMPALVTCFGVDREILNDKIWISYTEAIAPLASKYLHRLPSAVQEMQNDLDITWNRFAKIFYGHMRQFYSTTNLSPTDKKQCEAEVLTDIRLSFPEFTEPVVKARIEPEATKGKEGEESTVIVPESKKRLIELKELYDEGIITKEEYKQKRASIFDEL